MTWKLSSNPEGQWAQSPKDRGPQILHTYVTLGTDTRTLGGALGTQGAGEIGNTTLSEADHPLLQDLGDLPRGHSFGCPLQVPRKSQPTRPSNQQDCTKHVPLVGPLLGARDTEDFSALGLKLLTVRRRENK